VAFGDTLMVRSRPRDVRREAGMRRQGRSGWLIVLGLTVGLAFGAPGQAKAQTSAEPSVAQTAPPPRNPQTLGGPRLDEFTAYTIEDGQWKLGVLAFEYGITDTLSIGTDPPMWAARALVNVLVPNLHVKYNFFTHPRVRLTGQLGVYYADVTEVDEASGGLFMIPLTLWTTVPIIPRLSAHLETVFNFVNAFGTGNVNRADFDGAVSAQTFQLGAMLEYRILPWLAVTLRGRYQPWISALRIEGDSEIDPFTRAEVTAELTPRHEHPFAVIPGVTFLWKHVHLSVGVGYGSYFLPGANLYLPQQSVVPDASLSILF
jgi:hypothetical protein